MNVARTYKSIYINFFQLSLLYVHTILCTYGKDNREINSLFSSYVRTTLRTYVLFLYFCQLPVLRGTGNMKRTYVPPKILFFVC